MARTARNEVEREAEILWVVGFLRAAGPDVDIIDVTRVLNERRAATARAVAIALGRSAEEVEAAAAASALSPQTVRRDVRSAIERLHLGTASIAAVWLDEQIADCQADIERSYALDEQALGDLERSRSVRWKRSASRRQKSADAFRTGLVSHEEDGPGKAALYMVLIRNSEHRIRLRAELRVLKFGARWFSADGRKAGSLAEALTGVEDPNAALAICERAYLTEIDDLDRADVAALGPVPSEWVAWDRLRTQKRLARLQHLRAIVVSKRGDGGGDDGGQKPPGTYEIIVRREVPG